LRPACITLQPERVADALGDLYTRPVGAVERHGEVLEELRAVGGHPGADVIEGLDRQAVGVDLGLEHQRRHRAYQHGPRDAGRAVASDVAGDLPAAGGVAD